MKKRYSQQKLFGGLLIMMVSTVKLVGWQNQVGVGVSIGQRVFLQFFCFSYRSTGNPHACA